jgi:uncharacterized protein YciW
MTEAASIADEIGAEPGDGLSEALRGRADILVMTEAAEAAVLRPREPGAWSHALRAALAARIARLHGLDDLAAAHAGAAGSDPVAVLADPGEDGADLGLTGAVAFTDQVASAPRDFTAGHIASLQAAGVTDADIVRLAELNAFLAYKYRLVAGLRLLAMKGTAQ